jgi:hypothetical protein
MFEIPELNDGIRPLTPNSGVKRLDHPLMMINFEVPMGLLEN